MSKYLADDPWLEYMELPKSNKQAARGNGKSRRALKKRIARFRASRRITPYTLD